MSTENHKPPTTNHKPASRRGFLSSFAKAGIAATLLPESLLAKPHLIAPAYPEQGHVFLALPYLQNPTPTSMTVMWITNLPSYSWVEYGESNALGKKAHRVTDGIVEAYNRINRIDLKGLQPGTTYYYRICSKQITGFEPYKLTYGNSIESEIYSFTTPQAQPESVSWLVLNDIHDRPYSIPHLMKMHGSDPYDFVFFNGDIFDYQTNEQQIIDHMLQPCIDSFATRKPFLYVRGNHETRGKYRSELTHYFSNPQGQSYYNFTHGPVHVTVLDTGEDKPDDTPVYAGIVDFDAYREEQKAWAEEVMQSRAFKKAKFRIVLMHIPPFYSGDWHGPMHCRELFNPVFNKYKVDLVISGHTHKHGVHPAVAGQHNYPIVIGGGPKEGARTLIRIKADKKAFLLQMLDDSGKEVGTQRLEA